MRRRAGAEQSGRAQRPQGRNAEAERLYKQAVARSEKTLGPDHPDLADVLENLAASLQGQGRHAEAEPLLKRAKAIREKTKAASRSAAR